MRFRPGSSNTYLTAGLIAIGGYFFVSGPAEASDIGNWIIRSMRLPVLVAGEQFVTSVSAGFAVGQRGTDTPLALLRGADQAMYATKQAGKGRCIIAGSTGSATESARDTLLSTRSKSNLLALPDGCSCSG